jgi:glycerol-3-phosphate O-acyltransferase/dihydroxyacetone phosphate acyltransferase
MRPILDRFVTRLAHLLLAIFFRSVEVVGDERVPRDRPVVYVGNHPNGLIDPFLVLGFLPRHPRFLGKSTLWDNPVLRAFLKLGAVIPVYRAQDGGDTSQNERTFRRCFEELAAGESIALFPEGISHDEPELQPLKTGAARIALGAEHAFGPLGIQVVPFGLYFDEKTDFRSRALVEVGEPIPLDAHLAVHESDERAAARELTTEIESGLRAITLNRGSWEELQLVERAALLYAREPTAMPGRPTLAEHFPLRHAMGSAYDDVHAKQPDQVEQLRARVASYDRSLDALGLRDDHVAASYPLGEVLRYIMDRLPLLPLWLPVAAIGAVLNWIPYRIPGLVAGYAAPDRVTPATIKLFTALLVMPAFWLAEGVWVGLRWGLPYALVTAVVAPLTGWLALHFAERSESFVGEVRAWWTLRRRATEVAALRTERGALSMEIGKLVEAHGRGAA